MSLALASTARAQVTGAGADRLERLGLESPSPPWAGSPLDELRPQRPALDLIAEPAFDPTWAAPGPAAPVEPSVAAATPRSDRVLFVLFAAALGILLTWYRREESVEGKIRLAALASLASVVFLSVTAAMPWMLVDGGGGHGPALGCLLGQEGACAWRSGAVQAVAASDSSSLAMVAFEIQRWQCASVALRLGQITALALLLPALVWLLVDPRHRGAQAAIAVGASVAGFTFLVVLLYVHAVPSWVGSHATWTADLALLTSAAILATTVLVIRQSFALVSRAGRMPRAQARHR